jgi:hypothetical protein
MFNLKKSLFALLAVLTLYGIEVRAESFVISDVQGRVFISTSLDGGPPTLRLGPMFGLSGPGLSIFTQSHPSGDPGSVEVRDICMELPGCTPGRVIGTNSSFSGLIASQLFASAHVNDVFYLMVRVAGTLNFVSAPIVVPNFGSNPYVVTIPFTFSGQLTGDAFHPDVVNPVFTAMLTGQGQASFHFVLVGFDVSNPRYRLDYIEYQFEPLPILIDIKPATFPNSINPKSKGKIPVAILTTSSFDAATVDPTTLRFGATGNEVAPAHWVMEDVDGDGHLDMVLHFVTQDTGLTCRSTTASVTGAMFSDVKIKGSDAVETIGCN